MTGTPSRTARAATVRWRLKEAGGELPARGTRSAYEAWQAWGEVADRTEPDSHSEGCRVDATGRWKEGHASYPGRSGVLPRGARKTGRWTDGAPEVSRSHTRWGIPSKGSTK